MKKVLTLGMVVQGNRVLLGMKKRGFGEGRWNGFGGKLEEGESIEEALVREFEEEVGVTPVSYEKVGILDFTFESEPKELEVHIFKVTAYDGEPTESEEMRPQWFEFSSVPFEQMWIDDSHWFPYLEADQKFRGRFHFDRPATSDHPGVILEKELEVVEEV
ncbi:MAG: 7,8-dihydro-8-oxoguanine triphosphatase [Candidatus Parcubacteria bacterium]|jgi:8-oxo-dGTP diphosphatase/2-hydroxy-dATP diphosphatase